MSVFGALGSVFEAPALVSGLDDVAVMGEPIEQRGCHLAVTRARFPLGNGLQQGCSGSGETGRDNARMFFYDYARERMVGY